MELNLITSITHDGREYQGLFDADDPSLPKDADGKPLFLKKEFKHAVRVMGADRPQKGVVKLAPDAEILEKQKAAREAKAAPQNAN